MMSHEDEQGRSKGDSSAHEDSKSNKDSVDKSGSEIPEILTPKGDQQTEAKKKATMDSFMLLRKKSILATDIQDVPKV